MRKFHILDQGNVRTFLKNEPGEASIAPDSVFTDAGKVVPWEDILKTEDAQPAEDIPKIGAARLMQVKAPDTGKESLLLADSSGMLTVVEDGGEMDERSHRTLIGQGINLAALLATEWTAETLKKEFEASCKKNGRDPSDVLRTAFGNEPGAGFWKTVEQNFQAGRIRVIFLVSEATTTIQKVIDFLFASTNMTAYALKLDTYAEIEADTPVAAFTVRLYGPSKAAVQARSKGTGQQAPVGSR